MKFILDSCESSTIVYLIWRLELPFKATAVVTYTLGTKETEVRNWKRRCTIIWKFLAIV